MEKKSIVPEYLKNALDERIKKRNEEVEEPPIKGLAKEIDPTPPIQGL